MSSNHDSSSDANVPVSPPPQFIQIQVLSPSEDAPIRLPHPPITPHLTVAELKGRLQDALSSRPAPDHQRLIYRGRMLSRNEETMLNIFGQPAVRLSSLPTALFTYSPPLQFDSHEMQTLHLVLRPSGTSRDTQSNPTIRPSFTPPLSAPGLAAPAPPSATAQPQSNGPGGDVPVPGDDLLRSHMEHMAAASAAAGLPAHFQDVLQAQMAAVAAQHQQQHASPAANTQPVPNPLGVPLPSRSTMAPSDNHQHPPSLRQAFGQHVGHAQRARAAAGMTGVANNPANAANNTQSPWPRSLFDVPPHDSTGFGQSPPVVTNSQTREFQGPNGERWQIVVNEGPMTAPRAAVGTPAGASPSPISSPLPGTTPGTGPAAEAIVQPSPAQGPTSASIWNGIQQNSDSANRLSRLVGELDNQITQANQRILQLQADFARAQPPRSNYHPPMTEATATTRGGSQVSADRSQQDDLPSADATSAASNSRLPDRTTFSPAFHLPQPPELPSFLRSSSTAPQNQHPPSTTSMPSNHQQPPTVYVLSSPTGPQAILLSPAGVYATYASIPNPSLVNHPNFATPQSQNQAVNHLQPPQSQGSMHRPAGQQRAPPGYRPPANWREMPAYVEAYERVMREREQEQRQQPHAPAQARQYGPHDARHPNPVPNQVQPQARNQNQAADLLRILLPFGGHLWLLIRILGFVFIVTGGSGWRRTVLILLAALSAFIAQTGILSGVGEAIWGPIRRHLDGLLPLGGGEDALPPGAGVPPPVGHREVDGNNPNERPRPDITATATANDPNANPATTAARLVFAHSRRQQTMLRNRLRLIERAILMFLASLVPGVGERHVAAREEAARIARAAVVAREEEAARERGRIAEEEAHEERARFARSGGVIGGGEEADNPDASSDVADAGEGSGSSRSVSEVLSESAGSSGTAVEAEGERQTEDGVRQRRGVVHV
ncbi:MAG: hypothetical protein M1817_001008 [Caeruleum heppii]|nr:MAG: hypothetical protein M1817_001008 [Caeruleum heppii]